MLFIIFYLVWALVPGAFSYYRTSASTVDDWRAVWALVPSAFANYRTPEVERIVESDCSRYRPPGPDRRPQTPHSLVGHHGSYTYTILKPHEL